MTGPIFSRACVVHVLAMAMLTVTLPAHAETRRVGVPAFEKLVIQGDYRVQVVKGTPTSIVISGTSDDVRNIDVETLSGLARIKARWTGATKLTPTSSSKGDRTPLTITVTVPGLTQVQATGAPTIRIDKLTGADVGVTLDGSGTVQIDVLTADRAALMLRGNGSLTAAGTAKRTQLVVTGAGSVDAAKLSVGALTVHQEGAGTIRIAATGTANVTQRGNGAITVDGNAACKAAVSGTGKVRCGR